MQLKKTSSVHSRAKVEITFLVFVVGWKFVPKSDAA